MIESGGKTFTLDISEEAFMADVMLALRNGKCPANAVAQFAHLGWARTDLAKNPTYLNAIGEL